MLFLALIMSLFGFVIAAPGAVMIANKKNLKNINGKISIAGPLTNIFLSLIFVLIYFISTDFIQLIAGYGARINIFLALFNMIPFSLFDGAKIFKWSKLIWFVTVLICIFLLVLNFKYIGVI